jgi:catechol 2,3-dioxygenase-like lactoylglutathione lyase family enzyme
MSDLPEIRVNELNHVAISVSNLERSVSFYRDLLGFAMLPRPEFSFPGAWLRLGCRQELHLIADEGRSAVDRTFKEGHFALQVDELAVVALRLRAVQVAFSGPSPRPDGAQQIFVADPDGNVIEFCAHLPASVG